VKGQFTRPAHDNANETADKPITGYGEKILTNGRFTTEKEKIRQLRDER
jgi:hypothetical protein